MENRAVASFRFLELPGEIRNRIYHELLCAFDSPQDDLEGLDRQLATKGYPEAPTDITPAMHSINTAILHTSKQVHREAYDVMVKTNQFFHVKTYGIPLADLLLFSRLPIVTMDRAHAHQFEGYVLSIKITALGLEEDSTRSLPLYSFMVLGRDLNQFCRIIDEGDMYLERTGRPFSAGIAMQVKLNPAPQTLPPFKASIEDFFSEKTQRLLLQPLRTHLRCIKRIDICGSVSPMLADAVVADVTQQRWPDPEKAIQHFVARKEEGKQSFLDRDFSMAHRIWSAACYEMDMVHQGPSWDYLTQRGGEKFCSRLPELYFLTNLNNAQIFAIEMQGLKQEEVQNEVAQTKMVKLLHYALFSLEQASNAMTAAPYEGGTWRPTAAQVAKLFYRRALCIRLAKLPDLDLARSALGDINKAWQLTPRDEKILAEKEAISDWHRELIGEDIALLRL